MTRIVRFLPILLTLIFTLAPLHLHSAHAAGSSGDQLASDIDRALRSAEKSIFSGNFQAGAAIMNEVTVKLQELQATDPGNKKLITINSKFNQLQRKIGQIAPVAASPIPPPQAESGPGKTAAPDKGQGSVDHAKKDINHAAAENGTTGIDDQWLPKIKPLLAPNDPAYINPSGPSLHEAELVTRMDGNLMIGKLILADYAKQFPGGQSTHFLGQAIDDLRRAVDGYEKGRKDAINQQVAELRSKVERSFMLLEKNKEWTAASGNPIYIINKNDLSEIGNQLEALKRIPGVPPATVTAFDQDVAKVRTQDTEWREKKTAQDNAPRPFPAAAMTSLSLVAEMEKILKDRGIAPVEKIVIVDKDWWVQQGEFRYIKAAALQKDGEGPYFTHVTFKQLLTLSGYGPTELWEQGKKIRVAQ